MSEFSHLSAFRPQVKKVSTKLTSWPVSNQPSPFLAAWATVSGKPWPACLPERT